MSSSKWSWPQSQDCFRGKESHGSIPACSMPTSGMRTGRMGWDCLDLSHANSTQGKGGRQQHPVLNTFSSCTTPPKPSQSGTRAGRVQGSSTSSAGVRAPRIWPWPPWDDGHGMAPCTHGMIKCFGLDGALQTIDDKDHTMPRNPLFPCSLPLH